MHHTRAQLPRLCSARAALALVLALSGCLAGGELPPVQPVDGGTQVLRIAGFSAPESALYDPVTDSYLVSNVSGDPASHDHDGFISKLRADGSLLALRFVDGASTPDGLSAPKGMALVGRALYVTDIDRIRVFDADTGVPKQVIPIAGTSFLNDLTSDPSGRVYATEMGVNADFTPNGRDAVYVLSEREPPRALVADPTLSMPNGLVWRAGKLELVTYGSGEWLTLDAKSGAIERRSKLPRGGLDGVAAVHGGALAITSWDAQAVYLASHKGEVRTLLEPLTSPADLGYEPKRKRLLIPLMTENALAIVQL